MRICILIIVLLVISACSGSIFDKKIREGTVIYEVSYPGQDLSHLKKALFPSQMELYFSGEKTSNLFNNFTGLYSFNYISDADNNFSANIFVLNNNSYVYKTAIKMPPVGFDQLGAITIEQSEDTKEICGMQCKKLIIDFNNGDSEKVEIFYTSDIQLNTCNFNNLYGEIDGLMLEFTFTYNNILMKCTANKILKNEVSKKKFEIPEDADMVSEKIIRKLLDTNFL